MKKKEQPALRPAQDINAKDQPTQKNSKNKEAKIEEEEEEEEERER